MCRYLLSSWPQNKLIESTATKVLKKKLVKPAFMSIVCTDVTLLCLKCMENGGKKNVFNNSAYIYK